MLPSFSSEKRKEINCILRLAFVGTNYAGWQKQPNVPTVQGILEEKLSVIFKNPVKVIGCCRTDAGVHAEDYVANFKVPKDFEESKLLKALNSTLPKDIGVYEVKKTTESFNARYNVREKVYLYRIWNSPVRNPFLAPYVWHFPRKLDPILMEKALRLIKGRHDFSSFCKLEENKNTILEIDVDFKYKGQLIEIRFRGKYFLRHMVRRLTAAVIKTGEGKLSLHQLENHLRGVPFTQTAPAHGLTLKRVIL